ncbi:hypothetical protein [Sphingosinicella rhizophila]|uniref:Uncharacterized protein n=1 Tax=Sphingosinicella rhizophila TaxID=3050082 RepID=A0ABU3Q6B7_9SPHN|nr:hypothetical protein [Sphingosinicella sp. GR2756]MDT9598624.1 hypothetical protein [Sphingosinicella sp. GR2756]
MSMMQQIRTASDHVLDALVAGLELEFGCGAGAALAQHFLAAEEADFRWEARVEKRWVGEYESLEDNESDLDRVAAWGRLNGVWFCATMIVDGDGRPYGMMRCREFKSSM